MKQWDVISIRLSAISLSHNKLIFRFISGYLRRLFAQLNWGISALICLTSSRKRLCGKYSGKKQKEGAVIQMRTRTRLLMQSMTLNN